MRTFLQFVAAKAGLAVNEHVDASALWGQQMIRDLSSYQMPRDPQMAMFDFYALERFTRTSPSARAASSNANAEFSRRMAVMPYEASFGPHEGEQVRYMVEAYAQKLLPPLKTQLLEALHVGIAGELHHFYDAGNTQEDLAQMLPANMAEPMRAFLKAIGAESAGREVQNLDKADREGDYGDFAYDPDASYDDDDEADFYGKFADDEAAAKSAERRMKQSESLANVSATADELFGGNRLAFVAAAKVLYQKAEWRALFGGRAWAGICDGFARLYNTTTLQNLFTAIDHAYDLGHNTGKALNKSKQMISGDGYEWLQVSLDLRARSGPEQWIRYCSPAIARLVRRIMGLERYETGVRNHVGSKGGMDPRNPQAGDHDHSYYQSLRPATAKAYGLRPQGD